MDLKSSVEIIKTLFLDLLGYFFPGIITIVLLSISIKPENYIVLPFVESVNLNYLFFIIAYCVGYIVFGLGLIFDWICFIEYFVAKRIMKTDPYLNTSTIIDKISKPSGTKIRKIFRHYRSYAMTSAKSDEKIYLFTFRSDLARALKIICLFIGTLGLCLNQIFMQTDGHLLLYVILIISSLILLFAQIRFLEISFKIPFIIFDNIQNQKNNE